MNIVILHRLSAIYCEYFGRLFPHDRPSRVLTLLGLLRRGPVTQRQLVEGSGLSHPHVSQLVAKLCEAGIVEPGSPSKRAQKKLVLTNNGLKSLSDFEEAIAEIFLLAILIGPRQSDPARPIYKDRDSLSPSQVESGDISLHQSHRRRH
jgi:DNA-binding MarR family transcriptional regulator